MSILFSIFVLSMRRDDDESGGILQHDPTFFTHIKTKEPIGPNCFINHQAFTKLECLALNSSKATYGSTSVSVFVYFSVKYLTKLIRVFELLGYLTKSSCISDKWLRIIMLTFTFIVF